MFVETCLQPLYRLIGFAYFEYDIVSDIEVFLVVYN